MKRKSNSDGSPRRKITFGGATVDYFSPPPEAPVREALNCVLSFEEALKLHLSLLQALGKLNGYDRSTTQGRCAAVCLCIYREKHRVVVTETKARVKTRKKRSTGDSALQSADPKVHDHG